MNSWGSLNQLTTGLLSLHLPISVSLPLFLNLFLSIYIYIYIHISLSLSFSPSLSFSISQTIYLSIYLSYSLRKVYQTGELGCLDGSSIKMKELLALRSALYSTEFRDFICSVTGCEELTDRVDCSANAYVTGTCILIIISWI